MKIASEKWPAFIAITIAAIISGCATQARDLLRDHTVRVEKVSSRAVTIMSVGVAQEGTAILVGGDLRLRYWNPFQKQINVEIVSPDGIILEKEVVEYERIMSRTSRFAMFDATLKIVPPPGSTIRVISEDLQSGAKMGN